MPEPKTKKTEASVDEFLASVADDVRRADALVVNQLMREVTGAPATMWGAGIVGFGTRTITYANGGTADWMAIGFSPRKAELVLYLGLGEGGYEAQLARLGKHKTGKGCLYIKALKDIDLGVLRELITASAAKGN